MPVYEYECVECEKVFEVQQRITDDPLDECPECGGKVKKLISRSSFHLKGGGWYADGYSGPSNGNGNGKAKKDNGSAKKESTSTPPCQGGNGTCKQCPASA
ncbi:MAG TPA: zinc ribbon domain-containing protein [Desulfobulbus sp.]|nr:zinc ribbon domain-containing protein [Desulfobulbus sp.]